MISIPLRDNPPLAPITASFYHQSIIAHSRCGKLLFFRIAVSEARQRMSDNDRDPGAAVEIILKGALP
jgi:hypothetical protein